MNCTTLRCIKIHNCPPKFRIDNQIFSVSHLPICFLKMLSFSRSTAQTRLQVIWPAIRKKIPRFEMVPNFAMVSN